MKTLNLTKQCEGYYSNVVNNIEVIVAKYSKGWEGVIINNDLKENEVLYRIFADTKKDVVYNMAKFIQAL